MLDYEENFEIDTKNSFLNDKMYQEIIKQISKAKEFAIGPTIIVPSHIEKEKREISEFKEYIKEEVIHKNHNWISNHPINGFTPFGTSTIDSISFEKEKEQEFDAKKQYQIYIESKGIKFNQEDFEMFENAMKIGFAIGRLKNEKPKILEHDRNQIVGGSMSGKTNAINNQRCGKTVLMNSVISASFQENP
jgi:hypothetical protein